MNTYRFGEIELEKEKIIKFSEGLPGLEDMKGFVLVNPEQTRPIYWLQSVDDGDIALPVINTFEILQDYSIDVYDEEIEALEIQDLEDMLVLNVAVIGEDIAKMTVNLAAPVIINVRLGLGKQILIDNNSLSTRYPVFSDICAAMQRGGAEDAGADEKG